MSECCDYIEDISSLVACLRSRGTSSSSDNDITTAATRRRSENTDMNITILQYHSQVLPYVVYGYMINNLFANYYNYNMIYIMDGDDDVNYHPQDVRWNYIKIILDRLLSTPNDEYVLYVDSDFIIVSPQEFNLSQIIKSNEKYDILISAEVSAASGVAQCGSIIFRNTEWTRIFLTQWWELRVNSDSYHDQQAFSKLFISNTSGAKSHINILPIEAMNSRPLVPQQYKETSYVLHLMGQSTTLRSNVFYRGVETICPHKHILSSDTLMMKHSYPVQYGITPIFLLNATLHELHSDINASLDVLNNKQIFSFAERITALRNLRRHNNELKGYNSVPHFSNVTVTLHLAKALVSEMNYENKDDISDVLKLQVLNQYAEAGFEYFNAVPDMTEPEALALVREVDSYNDVIISAVADADKKIYYDRKITLCVMIGLKYQQWNELNVAKYYSQLGVNIYDTYVASDGWTTSGLDAIELLGAVSCQLRHFDTGIDSLFRVVELYNNTLYSVNHQVNDFVNFVRSLLNIGQIVFTLS